MQAPESGAPDRPQGPAEAAARVMRVLADELPMVLRLAAFLGEGEPSADDVVGWVATLALQGPRVEPGRERAWLLAQVLRLRGAHSSRRASASARLPSLSPSAARRRSGFSKEEVERLDSALRELDPQMRATVLLVLHEGLSVEEAARVQGDRAPAFARRYRRGLMALAAIDGEALDRLAGGTPRAAS